MYGDVLDIYKPSFRAVLEHLRDGRGPVLFHCSGEIYPFWFHSKQSPDVSILKFSWQGPHRHVGRCTYGACRYTPVMKTVMEMVDEKYGGMGGYVGFSGEEIEKIKANLKR